MRLEVIKENVHNKELDQRCFHIPRIIKQIYFYPNYRVKDQSSGFELFCFSLFVVLFTVIFPHNSCFILPFYCRK